MPCFVCVESTLTSLSVARAVVKNPQMLVLDEAVSSKQLVFIFLSSTYLTSGLFF